MAFLIVVRSRLDLSNQITRMIGNLFFLQTSLLLLLLVFSLEVVSGNSLTNEEIQLLDAAQTFVDHQHPSSENTDDEQSRELGKIFGDHNSQGLIGQRCGPFNSNTCGDGLKCVRGVFFGQCQPVDCFRNAVTEFNNKFDMETYKKSVFTTAGISENNLLKIVPQKDLESEEDLQHSTALQALVNAMNEHPIPVEYTQEFNNDVTACMRVDRILEENKENDDDEEEEKAPTTDGQTNWYGFHIEGGIILDASFSVFQIYQNGIVNSTITRVCGGAGGIGVDISAVIGLGFSGTPSDFEGGSVLVTDFELGLGPMGGIDVGWMFNDVWYMDFNVGAGVTGEGFGVGVCGNWKV